MRRGSVLVPRLVGVLMGLAAAGSLAAQATAIYTVTYVSAMAFMPATNSQNYYTSGSNGRFGDTNLDQHFYAPIDIPQGAIVDYIGLNNLNDGTAGVMVLSLHDRTAAGGVSTDAQVACTPHTSWSTDFSNGPLSIVWSTHDPAFLDVHVGSSPNQQFFGHAEVWWHRSVDASLTQAFNDVPPSNPYYLYIQALAESGITGGCGGGNFCPDNPVTRAQMAVFLAKALGLGWGSNIP